MTYKIEKRCNHFRYVYNSIYIPQLFPVRTRTSIFNFEDQTLNKCLAMPYINSLNVGHDT